MGEEDYMFFTISEKSGESLQVLKIIVVANCGHVVMWNNNVLTCGSFFYEWN
jgi:hypothetical protein